MNEDKSRISKNPGRAPETTGDTSAVDVMDAEAGRGDSGAAGCGLCQNARAEDVLERLCDTLERQRTVGARPSEIFATVEAAMDELGDPSRYCH